ncbi:Xaa-Pro aminopeptidase [Rhodoligotrophos appendicifer]|uniref:M24 family metallopeptidase n=1 Tax=Rhodoligotrophos appendicifer TaxID=987056 RepID=UPI001184847E|nr:Xaa-Pro peptidase family protein [Rhodoligotrophos appendicifer]
MVVTRPSIPAEEFAQRRARAVAGAKAGGFDALLVCSRGGGTVDRFADVMYLTNFYTSFPYTPDHAGAWSGRAHSFLVLPTGGRPRLVIDIPNNGSVHLDDGEIIYTDFVIEAAIQALKDAGLERGRIGIVGEDTLPVSFHRKIVTALPEMVLLPADDILTRLRSVKSAAEIEMLRYSSQIGSRMIETMMAAAEPGASHAEIVAAGMQSLVPAGGILYNSFMASGRGGENPKAVRHAFPTWGATERLDSGDWIRLGISGIVGGYVFDLSRSKAVGPASNRQVALFEAAISCIEAGIGAIRPGATAGDLAKAGLGKQEELGFKLEGVFPALGHGIGLGWDSPWLSIGEPTPITPGMVLCFERTVTQDGYLGDFEETVLVTETGIEMLTDATKRFW